MKPRPRPGTDLSPHDWVSLALQAGAPAAREPGADPTARSGGGSRGRSIAQRLPRRRGRAPPDLLARRVGRGFAPSPNAAASCGSSHPRWKPPRCGLPHSKNNWASSARIGIEPGREAGQDRNRGRGRRRGDRLAFNDGHAHARGRLKLLVADWSMLLRSIRVYRRLETASSDIAERALALDRGLAEREARGCPHDVGALAEGRVVFVATAARPRVWSNLPTKPLFVPLLHKNDARCWVAPRDAKLGQLVAGDETTLAPPNGTARNASTTSEHRPTRKANPTSASLCGA